MPTQTEKISCFSHSIDTTRRKKNYKSLKSSPRNPEKGHFKMRAWQRRGYKALKDAKNAAINAPMGSGKSKLILFLAAMAMINDPDLKTLISVPQTIISAGFRGSKLEFDDGTKVNWAPRHDQCNDHSEASKVNAIIRWLENPRVPTPGKPSNDKIALCCHTTLVLVYQKLKEEGRLSLFSDLFVWIDEAHHVKNAESAISENIIVRNGMGDVVSHLLNDKKKNVKVGLATATFHRGDRLDILTKKQQSKFTRFNLPYDEYLEEMACDPNEKDFDLETFEFSFLVCGPNFEKGIENLLKQRKGKDIIYIPHPNSRASTGDKKRETEAIIKAYQKVHGGKRVNKRDVIVLQGEDSNFNIIDLVDTDNRKHKKDLIIKDINKSKNQIDSIIAIGMFKEGADWVWADRSIVVGQRASLVEMIQMAGRVFRGAKGKKHVEVIQLLPFSIDYLTNEEKRREQTNDYLKAIWGSLLLEEVIVPAIPRPRNENSNTGSSGEDGDTISSYLRNVVPDPEKRSSILDSGFKLLVELASMNDHFREPEHINEFRKKFAEGMKEKLALYGVTRHTREISEEIWNMGARRGLRNKGINVSDIDFDILQKSDPVGFLLAYTSGPCGVKTLSELREAFKKYAFLSFEEARAWVHEYNGVA